jgi:hypothetical protein
MKFFGVMLILVGGFAIFLFVVASKKVPIDTLTEGYHPIVFLAINIFMVIAGVVFLLIREDK